MVADGLSAEEGVRRRVQRLVFPESAASLSLGASAVRLAARVDAGDRRAVGPLREALRSLRQCGRTEVDEARAAEARRALAALMGRPAGEG